MKKFFFFLAAFVAFAACTTNNVEDASMATASYGGPNAFRTMLEKTDSLIGHTVADKFIKLNGSETFGFTPVDLYTNNKKVEREIISFQRPLEVGGEKVDTIYTSNFAFETVEGKTTSSERSWDDGVVLWSGKEVTANTSWQMTNGTEKFNFNTWHMSSDAMYWSEDFKVEFPALNWEVSENTVPSEEYMVVLNGNTYRAKDFTSTVTYTASVPEGFGNDTKTYELINKLVVLSYVEPDPEDEVIGDYTKAWVERQGDKLVGTVQKWERHRLIPDVLVATESADFTRSFEGGEDKMLDVENVSYQTNATTWRGTGSVAFKATASNGVEANKFNPYFTGRATESKTIMGVKFNAEAVVSFTEQVIGTPAFTQDGNVYYNIYPYTGKAQMIYTVSCEGSSESLSANAEYNRSLREKAPDQKESDYANLDYTFEAEAEGRMLTSTKNDNSWNFVTTNYGSEVSSESHSVKLQLSVEAPALEDETFSSRDEMGKNDIKSVTKLAASSKRVVRDGHNVDVVTTPYEVVMKNGKKFNIIAKYDRPVEGWLGYAEVSNITKAGCTNTANGDKVNVAPKYNVSVELHNITKPVTKASGNVKTYTIENPYNELFVEENVLVNRWGEGNVEANGDKLIGTANFYEKWSLEENPRLINTQSTEFGFTLEGKNGEDVYVDNTNFTTTGNGWSGNGVFSYTDFAKNGSKSFENVYTGSADEDKTLSYDGMDVVFKTNLILTEAGQTIGSATSKTVNGQNYNVYPYSNKVNGVYTVTVDGKSASIEKSANAGRDILVLGDNLENRNENYAYSFEAEANGNVLVSSVNDNVWEVNTYNNGAYVSGEKKSMHMNLSATAPALQDETFANKAEMGQNNIKSVTKLAASSKRVSRDGIAVDEVTTPFEVVMKNGKKFNIIAKYDRPVDGSLSYAEITNITKASWTNVPDGDNVIVTPRYNVSVELHDNAKATKAGNVKNYVIENPYREIYEPVNELLKTWSEGIATPNGNGFDLTANFYEQWSLENTPRLVNTQKGKMSATLTGKDDEDVIAENTNFNTTSNGQVGSTSGTYSSTASNGAKSFPNNYTWTADNSKTFTYNGETVKFEGSYVISENGTTIGNQPTAKTVGGVLYNAFPYNNKVKGVYTVDGQSVTLNAESSRNILIKKEIPKIIPDNWGKIIGAGITAVPALSVNGIYADTRGNDVKIAHKCLAIRTDKGYIPVVYVMNEVVPTEAQVLAGNFTAGNFDSSFDSAVDATKNGGWIPAKANDVSSGIKYTTADGRVRSIQNESLAQWNWRNGNFSTRIDGYTFSVSNDGTLTVIYNGNVVMSIR